MRIQRIMQRSNYSREEIKLRMSKQIEDNIKMKLCDFVLVNDEQQLLTPQVLALHEKLVVLSK
jgi:dephospho-CoA kinase